MLKTLEVIWVFDRTTRPPKTKMYVCLDASQGWFLRINSGSHFRPCVKIFKSENTFLDHDSYVECSLLEVDEFEIEDAISTNGIVGKVTDSIKPAILRHLTSLPYIKDTDKEALANILG